MKILALLVTVSVASGFAVLAGNAQCDTTWVYFQMTNSCYLQGDNLDFGSAEANCKNLGGHLVSIHNAFENTFVQQMTESGQSQDNVGMTWIGLHYVNNRWEWTDGTDTSFMYWMKGMPEKEDKWGCAELIQDEYSLPFHKNTRGEWQGMSCGTKIRKYVCKKAPNY